MGPVSLPWIQDNFLLTVSYESGFGPTLDEIFPSGGNGNHPQHCGTSSCFLITHPFLWDGFRMHVLGEGAAAPSIETTALQFATLLTTPCCLTPQSMPLTLPACPALPTTPETPETVGPMPPGNGALRDSGRWGRTSCMSRKIRDPGTEDQTDSLCSQPGGGRAM